MDSPSQRTKLPFLLSEVRLHSSSSRKVGGQCLDIVRLGRVNLKHDRITRWDTLVRRVPIRDRRQQALEIDTVQRKEGIVKAIACQVVISHCLLQDSVGNLGLR